MTVKTTRAAGNQYISAPDHASFSIPAGDFSIGFIVQFNGDTTGNPQYILSTGNFQEAGSFNIAYMPTDGMNVYAGTASTPILSNSATEKLVAGQSYAYVVRRNGTVIHLKRCPVLTSAPVDGSAVVADGSATFTAALDGLRGMTLFSRADKAATRLFDQSGGRFFCTPVALTDLEIARYAFGEDIVAQLGKTVNWYVRLDTIDDIVDRGPSANVFTVSGAIANSSSQPAFGYTPPAEAPVILADPVINAPVTVGTQASYTPAAVTGSPTPTPSQQWVLAGVDVGTTFTPAPADAGKSLVVRQIATSTAGSVARTSSPVTIQALAENRVTANPIDVDRVIQRGFAVTLSCAYVGTTPTLIDFALYAATGSTLAQGWTALSGATISGGTASASAILPAGGPYRLAMRTRNGSGVIAESVPTTETFLIGADVGILGSSSAEYLYLSQSGDGFTVDPLTKTLDVGATAWGALSTTGAAALLSAGLRTAANVPIGLLPGGSSGSKLTEWLNTAGPLWTRFLAQLAKAGGKLEFAYVTVGSNDADVSSWTSPTPHFDNMRQFITNIRAACGQPSLPIVWVGSNRRTNIPNVQADFLRAAENMIGSEPNVTLITTVDQPMGDGTHMTATGFQNTVRRVSAVAGRRLFGDGVYMRGPMLTQGLFQNNRLRMKLTHRNGTDFTPGAGYTGITIADGVDALTFTTEKFSTTEFDIVGSRNFVAPVVKYQSGANPTVTAPIFDNGATPLPMQPESGITATSGDLSATPAAPTVQSVTVSPATATVQGGATQQYGATVTGLNSPSQAVTWAVASGSISAGGLFTAPAAGSAVQTIAGTATSVQDPTKSGAFTITVPAVVIPDPAPVPDPDPEPEPEPEPTPDPEPDPVPEPDVPDERNYAWIQAEVAAWLHRKDLTARIPKFITMAEARINRIVQARGMEIEATFTFAAGIGAVRLPVAFDTPIAAWVLEGTDRRKLTGAVSELLPRDAQRGDPLFWAISGAYLALDCPVDRTRKVTMRYRGLLRLTDSAPNNSVLTKYPDLYLYGTLMESAMWLRDAEALAMWAPMFDTAVKELNRNESRARAIAPLRTELAGVLGRGRYNMQGDY